MKKLITLLFIGIFVISCSKDDDNNNVVTTPVNTLSTTPLAKPAFDNSNLGIYKGVFVGSSGIVMINLKNDNTVSATLRIDGNTTTYTTTGTVIDGQATSLTFVNGANSFDFSVDADGGNADVTNINISGHPNALINVLKEFSDSLVECFEGTFTGDDTGIFNIAVINYNAQESEIQGLAYSTATEDSFWVSGAINSSNVSGTFSTGSFDGTRTGNSLGGNWTDLDGSHGSWQGQRTY